ncbi:alpha/beta fold hydrolase [Streptosporangium amethystogenes]|uniref:alpha/beta fold hydrolase n=1 Tax=Streptosporangium amethystogenes TaxID=2002 RepID=UPI0004C5BB2E|nr:alpha/beta fold hydrolase [Streptosporangium amethystogenes]
MTRISIDDMPTGDLLAGASLGELFAASVVRTPEAAAIVSDGRSVSYRELDEWSDRLARWLSERGVRPESRVALVLPRSVEPVLAVTKAGGVFVPVDPAYPLRRQEFMLADAAPAVVLRDTLPDVSAHPAVSCAAGGPPGAALLVHPGSGLSWPYASLLPHIDPGVPVYALQARGLQGGESLPASVEEMAAEYVSQIIEVWPEGPCRLLGWSFGGVVAHAMAAQLERAGRRVESLTLIDAFPAHPLSDVVVEKVAELGVDPRRERAGGPMRRAGLAGVTRRQGVRTTVRDGASSPPDVSPCAGNGGRSAGRTSP